MIQALNLSKHNMHSVHKQTAYYAAAVCCILASFTACRDRQAWLYSDHSSSSCLQAVQGRAGTGLSCLGNKGGVSIYALAGQMQQPSLQGPEKHVDHAYLPAGGGLQVGADSVRLHLWLSHHVSSAWVATFLVATSSLRCRGWCSFDLCRWLGQGSGADRCRDLQLRSGSVLPWLLQGFLRSSAAAAAAAAAGAKLCTGLELY